MSGQPVVCVRCGGPFGDQESPGRTGQGEPCHGRTLTCVEVLRRRLLVTACAFCGTEFPRDQPEAMRRHMLTCAEHPIARAAAVTLETLETLQRLRDAAALVPGIQEGGVLRASLVAALAQADDLLARWRACGREREGEQP